MESSQQSYVTYSYFLYFTDEETEDIICPLSPKKQSYRDSFCTQALSLQSMCCYPQSYFASGETHQPLIW